MKASLRRTAASLAILVGLLGGPAAAFDVAQSRIDFGAASDDRLDGGGGPAAVSGGTRPSRWERGGYGRSYDRYDRYDRGGRYDRGYADGRTGGDRPRYRYSSRSVFHAEPRSSYFRGTGVFANANPTGGSFVWLGSPPPSSAWNGAGSGPKIIDVASERLDHRPIGPDGISVHYSGATKIIRIDPGYRMSALENEQPREWTAMPPQTPPAVPEDTAPAPAATEWAPPIPASAPVPETRPVESSAEPALEPWTDEWLRDCVARHESFDASLGTYTDETGRRRFCTSEPA